jgi:hypothetical protein
VDPCYWHLLAHSWEMLIVSTLFCLQYHLSPRFCRDLVAVQSVQYDVCVRKNAR